MTNFFNWITYAVEKLIAAVKWLSAFFAGDATSNDTEATTEA